MGDLTGKRVDLTFEGLINTSDEQGISGTIKRLTDGLGTNLPVGVSTSGMEYYGTQDFTNATVTGIGGLSGTSGTSGVSGTSGTSGLSGTSGTSGINGTSGTSGSNGTPGLPGTSGTSGSSGTSGVSPLIATRTGTLISFITEAVYNTVGAPGTGNITFDGVGAVNGQKVLLIHNDTVAPSFPPQFILFPSSNGYSVTFTNFIYMQFIAGEVYYYIETL